MGEVEVQEMATAVEAGMATAAAEALAMEAAAKVTMVLVVEGLAMAAQVAAATEVVAAWGLVVDALEVATEPAQMQRPLTAATASVHRRRQRSRTR